MGDSKTSATYQEIGELGACPLVHQAFQKPPAWRRLLKGLVYQWTGTQLPAFDGPRWDVSSLPQRPLLCCSIAMAQTLSSSHCWRRELSVPPAQSATPSPAPPHLLANRGHSEGPLEQHRAALVFVLSSARHLEYARSHPLRDRGQCLGQPPEKLQYGGTHSHKMAAPSPLSHAGVAATQGPPRAQGQPKVQASLEWLLPSHPGPPEAQCLDGTDPGTPLLSASSHAPVLSSQNHLQYQPAHQVEAAVDRPAPLPLRLHTHLALGFCFHREDAALEGGPLLRRAGGEEAEGAECLLKCQPSADVLRPPRRSGQSSGCHASRPGLERTLSQALLELLPPASRPGLGEELTQALLELLPPASRPGLERN
ncbi:hypothetical protein QTO34_000010 [Cnephaeus nilssonii]|uniref:Uncharacterized protein n=1 Tax=Cnephaeus nilssonii TaxID=3371016 RepID=A0AA40LWJ6_CNENI|nr:hypothetical protein QTO34_000010 [Eptesicus nilssonii]